MAAEIMVVASGEKTSALTRSLGSAAKLASCAPSLTRQSRDGPCDAAVATLPPSGAKVRSVTPPTWPVSVSSLALSSGAAGAAVCSHEKGGPAFARLTSPLGPFSQVEAPSVKAVQL